MADRQAGGPRRHISLPNAPPARQGASSSPPDPEHTITALSHNTPVKYSKHDTNHVLVEDMEHSAHFNVSQILKTFFLKAKTKIRFPEKETFQSTGTKVFL